MIAVKENNEQIDFFTDAEFHQIRAFQSGTLWKDDEDYSKWQAQFT